MNRTIATIGCAAIAATLFTAAATPASADPVIGRPQSTAIPAHAPGRVETVQYRGRYNGRRDGDNGRGFGRNAGIGIGAAIIGGIVLSEAARAQHREEHGGDWRRCAQTYRSFEPNTGMYTGYDGERHTCPYLN